MVRSHLRTVTVECKAMLVSIHSVNSDCSQELQVTLHQYDRDSGCAFVALLVPHR